MPGKTELLREIPNRPGWRELPPGVGEAIRLVDATERSDCGDVAQAIEQTPELAQTVLKYMNSPFYGLPTPVTDVKSAVTGLGYEAIRNFMAAYLADFLWAGAAPRHSAFSKEEYWRHVLSTCIAADLLGQKIGFTDRFRLFTYGLVHDIGIVLLDRYFPEELDTIFAKVEEGIPLLVAEKSVLAGLTHSDIGAWLCRRWDLDDAAWSVINFHHTPQMAPLAYPEMLLLYLGNIIGTRVFETRLKMRFGESPADEKVLHQLGLAEQDMADVDAAVDDELEFFERNYIF